ncbi:MULTISPECIES: diacylglycerol kinase [unclassified Anaerobiospirillum]|uniref:diacylglycerol kinase n=1 Tax=unclassified Anaerobiospirillum TaxID=2647410 RepID=UPI001FF26E14|nr:MULTISPECIES: diacylglycerol kinase [unclassified Anaerobiospirillum]MCK0526917.1 diacylglycerol kinase [Anaerobiospirillum sp. NML120449]MCK0533966.1 diacylglycerol kinase [Anaerobiospirillum sp. NML120511]MCK0539168.1 diacylglycerol kinase [Anaerobiospirillum sp. NML02-A-032]
MAKTGATGLTRIINAGKYSMNGFKAGLKHEAALRQELGIGIILTLIAIIISDSIVEFLLLTIMPWLTFTVELLNSAVEAVVDRVGDEYHELSGRAKDLGSAAVFVMLCLTALTWILVIFS